ncbi:MAG TPA: hypothetical protein VKR58_11890 [Aquella sp.]|nr:hypothetical protein [Aquella sp.]
MNNFDEQVEDDVIERLNKELCNNIAILIDDFLKKNDVLINSQIPLIFHALSMMLASHLTVIKDVYDKESRDKMLFGIFKSICRWENINNIEIRYKSH